MAPRSQHICIQIPRSLDWEYKRQPTLKLNSSSHYKTIAGRSRPGLKMQNTQITNPGDTRRTWHPMPLVLHVITRNPTRQHRHAQLGAFQYVVMNLVSATSSVLMKITFSYEVWHHYPNVAALFATLKIYRCCLFWEHPGRTFVQRLSSSAVWQQSPRGCHPSEDSP